MGNINSAKMLDKDEWIVVPDAFEAIISQKIFDAVQVRSDEVRPKRKLGPMKRHLFSRKLRCGHCGAALERHEIMQGVYYTCNGRTWNGTDDCKKIRLFEADLIQTVLASIHFQAQLAQETEQCLERQAKNIQTAQNHVISAQQRIQQRIAQLNTQKAETYMEHADEFKQIADDMAALKEQKATILERQHSGSAANRRIQDAVNILNNGSAEITEWNESMIRQLVDTVKVLSADRIRVYLRGGIEIEQTIREGR